MMRLKVLVGECSIHIENQGALLMSIPHRMWEGNGKEEGVVWSGEWRGDQTTLRLAQYVERKIQGCEGTGEVLEQLWGVLKELNSPQWCKTFREEEKEKEKKKQQAEDGKSQEHAKARRTGTARKKVPEAGEAELEEVPESWAWAA